MTRAPGSNACVRCSMRRSRTACAASLRDRVEGAWLALGGPACCRDATELEDAEMFLDELAAQDDAGDLADHGELEESLEDLFALPDMQAGADAVEIMTVHKAKGLEFDTVIMPGLDRRQRHSEPPLVIWKALPDDALLLAPIREAGAEKDAAYEYVRTLEREAEDIEAGRLFYVAATRASNAPASPRLHQTRRRRRGEAALAAYVAAQSVGRRIGARGSCAGNTRACESRQRRHRRSCALREGTRCPRYRRRCNGRRPPRTRRTTR